MKNLILQILVLGLLVSCSDEYDKPLPEYESEIVVEAYVNSVNPLLNYAIITRTINFYNQSLDVPGVGGAVVKLFEGKPNGTEIEWGQGIQFQEVDSVPGLYFPPLQLLFVGKETYFYKLEVQVEGITTTSITQIPELVPMDSLWVDYIFNPNADSLQAYLKFSFNDPKEFGNYYLISDLRQSTQDWPLLWGALDREVVTDDVYFNSQRFVYSEFRSRHWGDTINMYLASVPKDAYDYWVSYENSRGNGGPFSQPINVSSTFDNSKGIFQGMAVDTRRIIIQKP